MIAPVSRYSFEEFQNLVREALLHLHDATYLQVHPLAALASLDEDSRALRGKRVATELLEAIRSLRPAPGTPLGDRAWRICRLLEARYIEGLSAGEVLDQLGLGKTQYHRDHAQALKAVASQLWDLWHLEERRVPTDALPDHPESLAFTEIDELMSNIPLDYVDVAGLLGELLALFSSEAMGSRVSLSFRAEADVPSVYGNRVALRQLFLALLNTAIEESDVSAALVVWIGCVDEQIVVSVVASTEAPPATSALGSSAHASLGSGVARRLVEAMRGGLVVVPRSETGPWSARVSLPIAKRPLLLVLDNHADFISLVTRYLAEHSWRVVGAQDVEEAKALAIELRPQVILLDVMLPGQDGWDLLIALKARPETASIPVIVCSVLYEPHVARALGASAYLPKPVSQAALLEALAPWRPGGPELAPSP
jgi:CheY-like chemotaxis protein